MWSNGWLYIQPIIKFEVFVQMISTNTNSNLPGHTFLDLLLGLYYNLLLIYRSATEGSVGVCSIE